MKYVNKTLILISILSYLQFSSQVFAYEKTGIDYDMSKGNKPLKPLVDTQSHLGFVPDFDGVHEKYSTLDVETQKNNNKIMILRLKKKNIIQHEFLDFDLSGRFESWKEYANGYVSVETRLDEKKDLILERTLFDASGNILEVMRDTGKKGYLSEKNLYSEGQITMTSQDTDGDGLFEIETIFSKELAEEIELISEKIETQPIPRGMPVYIGGLYNHGDIVSLNRELTQKLFQQLAASAANKYQDVKDYQKVIFKGEGKNKTSELQYKYPNRFDIYKAISLQGNKNPSELAKVYVISGDVFENANRVSIYYRLLGPSPVDNVGSGSIQMAAGNYSIDEAAEKIAQDILSKIPKL